MIKRLFLCSVFILGAFECAPAQDTLTVMTYNIFHGEAAYRRGQSSLGKIAELIRRVQPDLVALQEVDRFTERTAVLNNGIPFGVLDSLANLTKMNSYFGKAIDFEGGAYGIGLLSKQPFRVQKKRLPNPANGEPRVLLTLQVRTKSGRSLLFAGTHLDHQYTVNREAQVKAINDCLLPSAHRRPVILAGDFNFAPNASTYTWMEEKWTDAALKMNSTPLPTYPSQNPEKRIDYIFLSRNARWEILDMHVIETYDSDHRPVVARIVINEK